MTEQESAIPDEEFKDFLEKLSENEEREELPILVTGYNPAKAVDMSPLFDTKTDDVEGKADSADASTDEEPGKSSESADS